MLANVGIKIRVCHGWLVSRRGTKIDMLEAIDVRLAQVVGRHIVETVGMHVAEAASMVPN